MASTTILSDNGVSSGSAGIKTTGGNDGVLALQTTTSGGTATTAMTIDTSQNVGIGTSSTANAKLTVYEASTPILKLATSASGTGVTDGFDLLAAGSTAYVYNRENGPMIFATNNTEQMRIDSSGNLLVGTTSTASSSVGFRTVVNAGYVSTTTSGNYNICNTASASGTETLIQFQYSNVAKGGISCNGSTIAYNTSSDYRLKENIAPMTGALEKIQALKPCTYNWKSDGSEGEGFIAHELQEVVPQCVTGEKDAVDADGNPVYQGIDTSFLVATLTAAIQEQQALITTLTERITALEAK